MASKRNPRPPQATASATPEGEALDALNVENVQMHRGTDTVRLMEATIEAKAKKRRSGESSASPALRSSKRGER